jgi:hypothetical protein
MDLILQSFCFILILLILLNLFAEHFVNNPVLVYKVEKTENIIYIDTGVSNIDIQQYIYNINNVKVLSNKNQIKQGLVKDAIDINDKDMILTVLPIKKYIVFVMKKTAIMPMTIEEVIQMNLPIHCASSQKDIDLVSLIFNSLSITTSKIVNKDITPDIMNSNVVMLFDTLDNIKRQLKHFPSNSFEFINYDTYDIHILKVSIPFIYSENIDMSQKFPNYKSRFPVRKALVIDTFITVQNQKGIEIELYQIITNVNIIDQNNYYTMFFNYLPLSLQFLQRFNQHLQEREGLPILEQYADYIPIGNVDGYFNSKEDKLMLETNTIEGVPLKGNTFFLKKQDRYEENGTFIMGGDKTLVKQFPTVKQNDSGDDSRYRCYGDPSINNAGLCNSDVDEMGNKKRMKNVWDRPCENNNECPFYQANTKYKNYRGGCNDGQCELPIGVKRTSYRYYDKKTLPVCHNCPKENTRCCDQQSTKDYAFALDMDDRVSQKIK